MMMMNFKNTLQFNQIKEIQQKMGVTDSKSISEHIDQQFRSLRKYNDSFYGQITLVQKKNTHKLFALVQKIMLKPDPSFPQFLQVRKQFSPYLVKLHEYYSCSVDYCSGLEKYFFLLEYSQHTLYNEMMLRQEMENRWTSEELYSIFSNYLEMTSFLKDTKNLSSSFFKAFISNHFILYDSPQEIKTLENLLKVQNDSFEYDFHIIKNNESIKHLYLAPEAYILICNKERFEAKKISFSQKAIVFMMGMNFLECALLADISGVYNSYKKCLEFQKLQKVLEQLNYLYGDEIYQIVSEMVAQNPTDRLSIQEIKQFMKLNLKRRKITIPKHTKLQHLKPKELRV